MEKKNIAMVVAALAILLVFAGVAAAQGIWKVKQENLQANGIIGMGGMGMMHGGMTGGSMMQGMMQHHEEMEKVMEEGAYSDLAALREKYGINFMPWVENEEDFQLAKQMHEKMDKYHEKNGMEGCPMMQ
ncbi:hypothetical protein HYS31_07160 [Candidatus Woesearchaeota archaeon]|nr:hypothetical protein [Candidatus Woesearchaeota archaeon]